MLIKSAVCPVDRVVMELWDRHGMLVLLTVTQHGEWEEEVSAEEAEELMRVD